ncbi:hypothetical protein V498_04643 [Pseudogymnoascus sp. VKM F-4517 (FW-2822)]|nr:hypothetical protein V498_04643 [Pseudogymnoascus sp. VKM F-4517 (FW-2822)]
MASNGASDRLGNIPVLTGANTQAPEQNTSHPASTSPSKTSRLAESLLPPFKEIPKDTSSNVESPSTPRRMPFPRPPSLQMPQKDLANLESAYSRIPLSPKLDPTDSYGSPVIPRRSRGLDFSRAATNLHHSTLAEQSSPDSSPTITGRAMNIPGRRRSGHFSTETSSTSQWSFRPPGDRTTISSSLGSVNMLCSESSDSSSDEELMDTDDIDDSILTTPQVNSRMPLGLNIWSQPHPSPGNNWMNQSPAASSLINFQRARMRNGKSKKGSSSSSSRASPMSRSPPVGGSDAMNNSQFAKDLPSGTQSRRESISWAANQLHIDGSESDDATLKSTLENPENLPTTPARDGQRGVIRRAVTRRGNMLPKTKGFARIRAALAEEGAPVETEVRREATVIRQVRENDMDLEPARPRALSTATLSSPSVRPSQGDGLEDALADDMISLANSNAEGSFKQHAVRNSKGPEFWEGFEDRKYRTPPPQFPTRESASTVSDDLSMDSQAFSLGNFSIPSQARDPADTQSQGPSASPTRATTPLPAAIDIRRVNNKRRRDDDFDPMSFKRRAVSPGMSVHNSPVVQSPMQRDGNPWGTKPPSNSGSDKGMVESQPSGRASGSKRVGLQGMTDTNDSLMNMSIE